MDRWIDLKDIVNVPRTSNEKASLQKATEKVENLAKHKKAVNEEGLLEGLARVIKKRAKTFVKAREYAIGALVDMTYRSSVKQKTSVYNVPSLLAAVVSAVGREGEDHKMERKDALNLIVNVASSNDTVKKGLFELEGLMENVVNAMEKEGDEHKVERENAANMIYNISCCTEAEVMKGLFEYDDVVKGLVRSIWRDGDNYKVERRCAVGALDNIAENKEVKACLFNFPGLMTSIDAIFGNASLNGTDMKDWAKSLKEMIKHRAPVETAPPPPVTTTKRAPEGLTHSKAGSKSGSTPSRAGSPVWSKLFPKCLVRSNFALLVENQAKIKKVKKEKDDVCQERDDFRQKLRDTLEAQENAMTCVSCMDKKRDVMFQCGHLALCRECSEKVTDCP
eukprot:CAMPEP_0118647384 /NCGR_PEP_ID=MMETSP0785-20121206/8575_1 /TAXON_ID=91992 /ORGANISM="Bolidomonas pacifica, Strain CCMP 1866" /LENGTH=392 /DNA_ID=CAMNT_0006539469 /DNA_START=32 /DNA_END=1209 /DNA_ORIENTATION=-